MGKPLRSTGVQLRESQMDSIERLAEKHGTTRSAVIRAVIDSGLRAQKYTDQFEIDPDRFERMTIAEQSVEEASN